MKKILACMMTLVCVFGISSVDAKELDKPNYTLYDSKGNEIGDFDSMEEVNTYINSQSFERQERGAMVVVGTFLTIYGAVDLVLDVFFGVDLNQIIRDYVVLPIYDELTEMQLIGRNSAYNPYPPHSSAYHQWNASNWYVVVVN